MIQNMIQGDNLESTQMLETWKLRQTDSHFFVCFTFSDYKNKVYGTEILESTEDRAENKAHQHPSSEVTVLVTYIHLYIHMHTTMHTHTYMYTHIEILNHTYAHTYTHTLIVYGIIL